MNFLIRLLHAVRSAWFLDTAQANRHDCSHRDARIELDQPTQGCVTLCGPGSLGKSATIKGVTTDRMRRIATAKSEIRDKYCGKPELYGTTCLLH